MFKLRQYQIDFISAIREKLMAFKRIIAYAPTGAGKSKVMITIANMALQKGKTVLIISESKRIYAQLSKEIKAIDINAVSKGTTVQPGACHIAMAQTLIKRTGILTSFIKIAQAGKLLVIADEAHIGTMTKVLLLLHMADLIGFTASPHYPVAKHLPVLYKDIVLGPQVDDLIQQGYLSACIHWQRKLINEKDLVKKGIDFTEQSQEQAFEKPVVYDGLMNDLHITPFKKCIIFTASINHCENLYYKLREKGLKCIRYHTGRSFLSEEAAAIGLSLYMDMQSGYDICISVGTLTKGFDFPPIDLICIQRATLSMAVYLQMIGRASRLIRGIKEKFTVLDYGGNWERFGPWDMDRDWGNLWKEKKKRDRPAPIKGCPQCEYLMHVSKKECPNCGHIFEYIPAELVQDSVLVEMTGSYSNIRGKRISELTAQELSIYAKFKNKKPFAIRIARQRETQEPGFLKEFGFAMGYKDSWAYMQGALESETQPDFLLK